MEPVIPKNWSYEEFLAFTMLYAASVDGVVTEEEEDLIREQLSEERFEAVKAVFDQCSDYKCINVILSHHDEYFATPEARERLLGHMREVFESDHRFSQLEHVVMDLFRRIV